MIKLYKDARVLWYHVEECGVDLQGGLNFNPSNITAVSLSSTFFNYAPCLIQNSAAGAAFTAVGVNFVPQVCQLLCASQHLAQHSCPECC